MGWTLIWKRIVAVESSPFWQVKTLDEMSSEEWESLCDGCGKCCLHKLEDEDDGEVYYTDIACRYLDEQKCRCMIYPKRLETVAECICLTPDNLAGVHWLPATCAYRLLYEGKNLPDWHPLVSGDRETVHHAGFSVRGKVFSEVGISEDEWEDHIILGVK
ncbi:MAG: hypothetical protein CSB48_11670 [Proteobacteria bacterium]|nr:MAG: hypothetical protein CSB48_11670 [Pseudomonadota bacterium]PIE40131.1 MAG: hypothetical protein CSA51_02525 [Gammaproteobacteria bacterium]